MIGNCHSAALVSRRGAIEWLCFPRFDSPAVFAALLGDASNGHWTIAPSDPGAEVSRRYRPGTLILETTFRTGAGVATVTDFMFLHQGRAGLVRIVAGTEGAVEFDLELIMRFDYGRTVPWVTRLDDGLMTAVSGADLLMLQTPVPLENRDMRTTGRFTVEAGERRAFSLLHQESFVALHAPVDPEAELEATAAFWTAFSSRCPVVGPWTEDVRRSLITLKALIYAPTGGRVAAATTSLPEWIGGTRNWDYRYCWLRDSAFTLMAFMDLGFYEEAEAWRDWLLRAVVGDPSQMQIMYGVAGERTLIEWEATWLAGFRGSRPVRIGNAASGQVQLDVYGEVAEMLVLAAKGGIRPHPHAPGLAKAILPFLETIWRAPDEGIWEVRGGRRQFVHSKVMAWVAFERAATLAAGDAEGAARRGIEPADVKRWRALADEIHAEVCANGYDAELGSFVQSYGAKTIDASLLQIALTGFLPPDDPRVVGTVRAVESHLLRDGFVARYDAAVADDGIAGVQEGTFLFCSFWLIDAYVLLGRHDDALALFERLRVLQNDVGLLAEEYDPVAKTALGNFPQAFSHVGLIIAALNLARAVGPAAERTSGGEGAGPSA
jgi:GH15 family glucan-1,4-alpha-glucosidase